MKLNEAQRIKAVIDLLKITHNKFAKSLGFNNTRIFNITSGRNGISQEVAGKIVEVYPIFNYKWLLTGIGDMLNDVNVTDNSNKLNIGNGNSVNINNGFSQELQNSQQRNIDLLDKEIKRLETNITGWYYPNVNASAGLDLSTINDEFERVPVNIPSFGKDITFINVYGDSMHPKYSSGDIIGIKEIEYKFLTFGLPYVVTFNNGDVHVKYVKSGSTEDSVLLLSENDFYEPREFELCLIHKFYSIRGVVKKEMF